MKNFTFESLENRNMLCGPDGLPESEPVVEQGNNPVVAVVEEFPTEELVPVAEGTFVQSRGGAHRVVYAKLDNSGFVAPNREQITGKVTENEDGSLDFSTVIPRSAGQRRLELAVQPVVTTLPNVTIRSTPPGWKPDPTSSVAPTVQAARVLGPSSYDYEAWGLQQAQATWERLGPSHWERVYANWYSSEELDNVFDSLASTSMRSRVVYGRNV